MSSFNHFVQKVCYTALNSYCQEGILYSLPCHIPKVNVILLYFSCLTFYFFSNLFTSKLPLITFQVFTECCFLLTLPKPNATNSYFYIFEKNVLRCEFHKPPLPPPTPKMSWKKMSWQVFCEGKGCFLFKVNVVSGLVCAHKALQNPRLQLAVTAVVFKVWDGQEEQRGRLWWYPQRYRMDHIQCVLAHTCFAALQSTDGEIQRFMRGRGCSRILLTSPFESKAPNTKEASCL